MAECNHLTPLQSVDFAVGGVLLRAYDGLERIGPRGFQRFLERPAKGKIFRGDNEDLPSTFTRVAQKIGEEDQGADLLPLVIYCRPPGLVSSDERPPALAQILYNDARTQAMQLSVVPLTLTYDIAFLAWDKLSQEHLALAWHCFIAQPGRKNSRFVVPYRIGGEDVEVHASIVATRDILTENASLPGSEGRLWAARTRIEVKTQVLYGREVEVRDERYTVGGRPWLSA